LEKFLTLNPYNKHGVKMSEQIKYTIPFPLAVAITVAISLPFGMLLGNYNLPLWVSFIAWAEYFVFGAKPEALKKIFIGFPFGGLLGGLFWIALSIGLASVFNAPFIIHVAIGNFVFVTLLVYTIQKSKFLTESTLAAFNGLSMFLGVLFTGSYPKVTTDPYLNLLIAWLWASIAGIFGGILGWLNVILTFPRKVKS
jgi:hypothetical protein